MAHTQPTQDREWIAMIHEYRRFCGGIRRRCNRLSCTRQALFAKYRDDATRFSKLRLGYFEASRRLRRWHLEEAEKLSFSTTSKQTQSKTGKTESEIQLLAENRRLNLQILELEKRTEFVNTTTREHVAGMQAEITHLVCDNSRLKEQLQAKPEIDLSQYILRKKFDAVKAKNVELHEYSKRIHGKFKKAKADVAYYDNELRLTNLELDKANSRIEMAERAFYESGIGKKYRGRRR